MYINIEVMISKNNPLDMWLKWERWTKLSKDYVIFLYKLMITKRLIYIYVLYLRPEKSPKLYEWTVCVVYIKSTSHHSSDSPSCLISWFLICSGKVSLFLLLILFFRFFNIFFQRYIMFLYFRYQNTMNKK